jgi:hypothetical protein
MMQLSKMNCIPCHARVNTREMGVKSNLVRWNQCKTNSYTVLSNTRLTVKHRTDSHIFLTFFALLVCHYHVQALEATWNNINFRKHANSGFNIGIVHVLSASAVFTGCRFSQNDRAVTVLGRSQVAFTDCSFDANGESVTFPYTGVAEVAPNSPPGNHSTSGAAAAPGLSATLHNVTVTGPGSSAISVLNGRSRTM